MGVDAVIYAKGKITDDELEAANEFAIPRFAQLGHGIQLGGTLLVRDLYDADTITVYTLDRYYGPGYERGTWPVLYAELVIVRAALPGCSVYYEADHGVGETEPVDPDFLERMWNYYLSEDWDNYYKEMAR